MIPRALVLLYAACLLGPRIVGSAAPPPRDYAQQAPLSSSSSTSDRLRVPGESPAYHCSDPTDDIFQIRTLDFIPTNPRVGYYLTARIIGRFVSPTGDVPWLNITGSVNGRQELGPLYDSPLCDIDVFQQMTAPRPGGDGETPLGLHRSCPSGIKEGYAEVSSPPMPLRPDMVPTGRYELRAEAKTQDGRRIFCVEGSFDITT